jgi:hemophore-related protein
MILTTKVVVAAAGMALSLGLSSAIASATPDVGAVVNTTCSYDQVIAALNDHSPESAAEFTGSPVATGWLHEFLGAPVPQRQQMLQQVQSIPAAAPYTALVVQVANTCNNY